MTGWLGVVATAALAGPPGEGRLQLADLPAYEQALRGRPSGSAEAVTFRDLWSRSDAYRGRFVRVEGKVERRFAQDPVGSLPGLTELWLLSPAGDPFCLVYPSPGPEGEPARLGTTARFEGTFLRRLEYAGLDGPRLAPLIVGPRPPVRIDSNQPAGRLHGRGPAIDWSVALILGALVALLIGGMHLRRPRRRLADEGFWSRPPDAEPRISHDNG